MNKGFDEFRPLKRAQTGNILGFYVRRGVVTRY